jgi:hypothetical protein
MTAAAKTAVWSLAGQADFARVVGRALSCAVHVGTEVPACDVVHIVGMFDCPSFATTLRMTRAARDRVYHWAGPDAANCFWADRIPEGTHVCATSVVLPPVRIHAPVAPFTGAPIVAIYGGTSAAEYGIQMAMALHECLPGVRLLSYARNQFAEELMPEVIAATRVYLRLRQVSDGCVSSREYLAAGRRVVSTEGLRGSMRVAHDDLPSVLGAVVRALEEPEPDHRAAAYWTPLNADARYAEEMERVLS